MKISSFTKYLRLRVINTGYLLTVVIAAVFLLMMACPAKAQDAVMKPSASQAQAAWDRGDYERAYNHFNSLLLLYTRDPLYQYYTGACLVRMERDIQRAVTLLSSAINSSVNIKSVPDEVWFYYGRALQMSGNYGQAAEAFERFSKQAGKKVAAGYNVESYIDQCNAGTGAVKPGENALYSVKETERSEKAPGIARKQAVNEVSGKAAVAQKQAANEVSGKANVTEEAIPVAKTDEVKRGNITDAMKNRPVTRGDTAGIPADHFRVLGEALSNPKEADSMLLALERGSGQDEDVPDLQQAAAPESGRLILFEIRKEPAYSDSNPVPVDPGMPEGLVYTVQIAAFRNNVAPALFRGLYPVFGKRRQGSDAVYYYTGMFRSLDDARKALPEARGAGFTDAFIIAMADGIQVSIERALILEKEWGKRPLPGNGNSPAGSVAAGNNSSVSGEGNAGKPLMAGTLSFRAEVMRVTKPVKPEVTKKIELLAGIRGLDMIKNSLGETVFLIGNFITFESADDYVSLLIRNGYSEARVAAYVGMQEIPVEAARELLNKMPDD